jgi:hypothetical protein
LRQSNRKAVATPRARWWPFPSRGRDAEALEGAQLGRGLGRAWVRPRAKLSPLTSPSAYPLNTGGTSPSLSPVNDGVEDGMDKANGETDRLADDDGAESG